mmetsp:Transcript_6754/g.13896  ORF Transcript_6754/g.13896 Transcript_6754/m.13896 type:complete len:167 (-) Transcript_6754:44-544(-)
MTSLADNIPKRSTSPLKKQTAIIPLPLSHIRRTSSEIQLAHDEMVAQWRDYRMRQRVVSGMVKRCEKVGYHPKMANALENIMRITTSQDFAPSSEQSSGNTLFYDDDDWILSDNSTDDSHDCWSLSRYSSRADTPTQNEKTALGEINDDGGNGFFHDETTIFEMEL